MTIPKAVSYKNHTRPNHPEDDFEKVEEEILAYNAECNAYTMTLNQETVLNFIGDEEDYLNCKIGNYEEITKKYHYTGDIIAYSTNDWYNGMAFRASVISGVKRRSDKFSLMPYGIYTFASFGYSTNGFKPITINVDEYVKFDNSELENLQNTVVDFYAKKHIYEENKSRHKGASLIYGSPGTGKSTALMNLINKPELKDMYIIFIPKHMSFKSLEAFKQAFEGHNTLLIMEEMTERLGSGTEDILNFLDGYSSWNNCYTIATTNYPEVLPPNLVDRPGRFNHLIEVKLPTDAQKEFYFQSKGFSEEDIKAVLPKTKDFSMDYIAQLALTSKLQQMPLDQCLTEFESNKKKVKNTFKGKGGISL